MKFERWALTFSADADFREVPPALLCEREKCIFAESCVVPSRQILKGDTPKQNATSRSDQLEL